MVNGGELVHCDHQPSGRTDGTLLDPEETILRTVNQRFRAAKVRWFRDDVLEDLLGTSAFSLFTI